MATKFREKLVISPPKHANGRIISKLTIIVINKLSIEK
jgi:hypothetical protein